MACLKGVAQEWWENEDLRAAVKQDLSKLVVTKDGLPVAKKDQWHAIHNEALVIPIIKKMRAQHLLKTPYMSEFEKEVGILAVASFTHQWEPANFPELTPADEIPIHMACISLKKIMGFLRNVFRRQHVCRDRGSF